MNLSQFILFLFIVFIYFNLFIAVFLLFLLLMVLVSIYIPAVGTIKQLLYISHSQRKQAEVV